MQRLILRKNMRLGKKGFVIFFAVSGFLVILLSVFLLRPSLLIVTDDAFDAIYGERRSRAKVIETSLKLFRRVRLVKIADNAGSDMVAFAVAQAGRASAVLFPYRYLAGALRYAENSSVPVYIFGGRAGNPNADGIIFIESDLKTDLYRAGLFAGLVSTDREGEVVFFQSSNTLSMEERAMFEEGLRFKGFEKAPKYLSANQDYTDNQGVSCIVMMGYTAQALEQNPEALVILFSWIDPDLSPPNVKLIFDDSIWAFAVRAVRFKGSIKTLPSEVRFLGRRIENRELLRGLKNMANNMPNI